MVKSNVRLSAQVRTLKGAGRCRTVSQVVICCPRAGQVARATLGGAYSEDQAVLEYARFPGRFQELPGAKLARMMGVQLPRGAN